VESNYSKGILHMSAKCGEGVTLELWRGRDFGVEGFNKKQGESVTLE
jgi:hypothetical protein